MIWRNLPMNSQRKYPLRDHGHKKIRISPLSASRKENFHQNTEFNILKMDNMCLTNIQRKNVNLFTNWGRTQISKNGHRNP